MPETIYLLWFVKERSDADDTEILIGAFSSGAEAERAIGQLKSKPGFVSYPEGFQIHPQMLGQIGWTEGFVEDSEITLL